MNPVNLFDLASQQARWLSVRQSTVASNVANVNTPGFRAGDVEPFEQVLDKSRVAMATTHPTHISLGSTKDQFAVREVADNGAAKLPSDNTVVLEDEMLKAGQIGSSFQLNTSIVKAFHRMILMAARS
ncbi:flagellar basal body rod protein FlgB [Chelativorans sp. ZYF759]|uniref:flagellar basal body rod protein FlgB n=1 Tax=Chelativorans sp. ZYF759 TaxID=2692213 RepID=UPI00145DB1EC|nr:flagellar basal body rod protein FlgB [Chelativorans sp. ZYF759]NMG39469.1 flagellar basal body rod protein FlgB [Chelativorans sp. ZYF759]